MEINGTTARENRGPRTRPWVPSPVTRAVSEGSGAGLRKGDIGAGKIRKGSLAKGGLALSLGA